MLHNIYKEFHISDKVLELSDNIEKRAAKYFKRYDELSQYNELKVLKAMQKNRVTSDCLSTSTGYGYNDYGRDTLEAVYADVFHTEDALVRAQIVSGTHALYLAMVGVTKYGDEILAPAGAPYDTLESVIGIRKTTGSLIENGISYRQVELLENGDFDYEKIKQSINDRTKLAIIQRSKGYTTRESFCVKKIGKLIRYIKEINKDIICMVDNCYGEFVDEIEPSDVGADLTVGSLIKNPGGGLAASGGYIVGLKNLIERIAARLTAPGLGKEVGASLGQNPLLYHGFFQAPIVTAAAVKGAVFAAGVFEELGYICEPKFSLPKRSDIIQAITLNDESSLLAFCEGIQAAAPVDSYVTPVADDMPGYDAKVVMAAGTFIQGASIELSADAPLKKPYHVFYQGGLSYPHAKIGVLMALQKMIDKGCVCL